MTTPTPPTPTPRVDAAAYTLCDSEGFSAGGHPEYSPEGDCVDADFARALERECAGLRAVLLDRTPEMISAALTSHAPDDEGEWPILLDILDCSGEDKARRIVRAALQAAGRALNPTPRGTGE